MDDGGFHSQDACLCRAGLYYSEKNSTYDECRVCPSGASCGAVGAAGRDGVSLQEIVPQIGFWRTSLNSTVFSDCSKGYQTLDALELGRTRCCPLDPLTNVSKCQIVRENTGANNTSWTPDEQCQENYRGTLCLECVDGYVRVGDECYKCLEGASFGKAFMASTILIVPIFFGSLLYLFCCNEKTIKNEVDGNKVFGQIKIMGE